MDTIGSYEAKTHLSRLLQRVANGEKITITRHGVPVALLVPVDAERKPNVSAAIEKIMEFRKGRGLGSASVREMIEEGRRF